MWKTDETVSLTSSPPIRFGIIPPVVFVIFRTRGPVWKLRFVVRVYQVAHPMRPVNFMCLSVRSAIYYKLMKWPCREI